MYITNRIYSGKLNDITKQLDKISKESHARPHETPLSNDEIYNRIISSSFERISNSKELAINFLILTYILALKHSLILD